MVNPKKKGKKKKYLNSGTVRNDFWTRFEIWHSYCVRQNNFVTSSTVLGLTEVLSPTGNPPVIPGGHWSHLPGLHQRRVGQWLCNHRAHAESRGLQSFNEDWHAGCARRCSDNGPITAQCLQCAKDNDPSVWVNQMEKKVHLHVRGRKWKVERERLSLCVILYCVLALARASCHRVCSFVCLCACACVCMLLRRVDRVHPGVVEMLAHTLCFH